MALSDTKTACVSRYEEALADLGKAASHAPEDKNVIKATARVKKLQKKQEDKEKKMCASHPIPPRPAPLLPCGVRHFCAVVLANALLLCACASQVRQDVRLKQQRWQP